MKRRVLVLVVGLWASLGFLSCGSSAPKNPPSGLQNRVLASQGVTSTFNFGGLVIVNGQNDTIPQVARLGAGSSPGLMAISPTRNIAAAFDASSNNVYAVSTTKEASLGNVHLQGPTSSFVLPTALPIGYAAVPTATVTGFSFLGAVDAMNFASGGVLPIAVSNAQTVITNSTGTQLLVFSNDSDSVTVLSPGTRRASGRHQLLLQSAQFGLHHRPGLRPARFRHRQRNHRLHFELRSSVWRQTGQRDGF